MSLVGNCESIDFMYVNLIALPIHRAREELPFCHCSGHLSIEEDAAPLPVVVIPYLVCEEVVVVVVEVFTRENREGSAQHASRASVMK